MGKRPDVALRNKTKKQREAVGKALSKPKSKCIDCGKDVSARHVTRCLECNRKHMVGENHNQWREKAGYSAVHKWVRKQKEEPKCCEHCKKVSPPNKLHLSHKDHNYTRILEEWMFLCPKCHRKYDTDNGLINMAGENHWAYGKHHTKETREKISQTLKRKGISPQLYIKL